MLKMLSTKPQTNTRTLAGCVLACVLALMVGCQQPVAHGPNPYEIDAEEYDRVFEAALQVLRREGFHVDRQDYRFGVITCHPRQSGTIFEPWREDNSTAEQALLATTSNIRRRVRVTLEPMGPQPASQPISVQEQQRLQARETGDIDAMLAQQRDADQLMGRVQEAADGDVPEAFGDAPLPVQPPALPQLQDPDQRDLATMDQQDFAADAQLAQRLAREDLQADVGVTLRESAPAFPLYALGVEVLMERLQVPDRFVRASASQNVLGNLRETPAELVRRGIDGPYWEPIGRDPHMEMRLLGDIVRRSTQITDLQDFDFIQP